jgi:hypothetical protein
MFLCSSVQYYALMYRLVTINFGTIYEGESNENRKSFFKFNLLNESGTQLYHFST